MSSATVGAHRRVSREDKRMAKPRQVRATASVALQEEKTVAAKLQPIADRVVVKPLQKEEMTKSGLIIPDTAKEKPQEGEVVAVGVGKLLDSGKRAEMEVKVGDRVLFAKYGGTEFKLDGDELLVLRESDILAVIDSSEK
jgi:chaperonin GroES